MSNTKSKPVSVSLKPEFDQLLVSTAFRMGHGNKSLLIRELVENYLDLMIGLEPEVEEALKRLANRAGHPNISPIILGIVTKYLDLMEGSSNETPIVLRVPKSLGKDPTALRNWFEPRVNKIVETLSKD